MNFGMLLGVSLAACNPPSVAAHSVGAVRTD
jgi:hypothetical protein